MQLGKNESRNLKKISYDESNCREELIDYIIRAEQLFNMMKTHDFVGTTQWGINPQFKGWFGNTVKRYIMKKIYTQKEI